MSAAFTRTKDTPAQSNVGGSSFFRAPPKMAGGFLVCSRNEHTHTHPHTHTPTHPHTHTPHTHTHTHHTHTHTTPTHTHTPTHHTHTHTTHTHTRGFPKRHPQLFPRERETGVLGWDPRNNLWLSRPREFPTFLCVLPRMFGLENFSPTDGWVYRIKLH